MYCKCDITADYDYDGEGVDKSNILANISYEFSAVSKKPDTKPWNSTADTTVKFHRVEYVSNSQYVFFLIYF